MTKPTTSASICLLLLLCACTTAHSVDGDGGRVDGFSVDAADGGPDTPASDGGERDVGADSGSLRACSLMVGERAGEGCFCHGPIASFGDALYRQSIGIEIYDVSSGAPLLAGRVDERAASEGGLAIHAGHLVSVRNIESALAVYRLDDPFAPVERSSLAFEDSTSHLAVAGSMAAVGFGAFDSSTLVGVSLRNLDRPTEEWRVTMGGRLVNLTATETRIFALTRSNSPTREVALEVWDAQTGGSLGRFPLDDPDAFSFYVGLATHAGSVLIGTNDGLRIYELDGGELVDAGRVGLDDSMITALSVRGDLAFAGGSSLHVVDFGGASPRELGNVPVQASDFGFIASDDDTVFVSNNGGVTLIALDCE